MDKKTVGLVLHLIDKQMIEVISDAVEKQRVVNETELTVITELKKLKKTLASYASGSTSLDLSELFNEGE